MTAAPTREGQIPLQLPSIQESCSTYYKVFGDLSCGRPAVIVLHGGPGAGHDYCLPFARLWSEYGLPVILYDQVGCGQSTHLRHKAGDKSFWREELFLAELRNVLDFFRLQNGSGPGYHMLGQSWGGMLAAAFAATRPRGLRRLVLAGAVAKFELQGLAIHDICQQFLPPDVRDGLADAERRGDYDGEAYQRALYLFHQKLFAGLDPLPPEMAASMKNLTDDTTVYGTMYGPSVLTGNGSLVGWTVIPRLPRIQATTLLTNGEFDSSDERCTAPLFENIPHVRWITFANGHHMCHLQGGGLGERVLRVIGDFLCADQSSTA